jgi:TIR domain
VANSGEPEWRIQRNAHETDEASSELRPIAQADSGSSLLGIEWLIAGYGRDVTDDLLAASSVSDPPRQDRLVESTAFRRRPRVYSREQARVALQRAMTDLDTIRTTFAREQEGLYKRQLAYRSWWENTRSLFLELFDDPSVADRVLPSAPTFLPETAGIDLRFEDVYGYMDRSRDKVGALLNDLDTFAEVNPLGAIADAADIYRGLSRAVKPHSPTASHDVFICHASEDKDLVVRPLAVELTQLGLLVWYDEFELRIGDSLRRKIDRGLVECRFGIVVLSPAFFRKEWPQRELDGLVSRETAEGGQIILPIWHDVGRDDVLGYSPTLADKVAKSTSTTSISRIAAEVAEVVRAQTDLHRHSDKTSQP